MLARNPEVADLLLSWVVGTLPALDRDAEFIPEITHMEALERRLRVMDSTALALCMENAMPLNVFNMDDDTNLARIISGVRVGTLVSTSQGEGDGG